MEESNTGDTDIELNNRGIPARKRKKNSRIYGADDLVTIPVKSPKKKLIARESKKEVVRDHKINLGSFTDIEDDDESEDVEDDLDAEDDIEEAKEHIDSDYDELSNVANELAILQEAEVKQKVKGGSKASTPRKILERVKPDSQLEEEISAGNRINAQRLGVALRNLLKLPKAHKWVCFEFFYSNIDKVLFQGENDFLVCLRESFPQLKTRRLTRVEWAKVRRLMGKPRRCSEAFFAEERAELERKRQKIRLLQQRKIGDLNSFKDLPDEIPMQLTIGARVTARLRAPLDGLFCGQVDAVDTSDSSYRVTFSRQGLGTHSVPDTELLSTEAPDLLPLSSFLSVGRARPLLHHYLSPPHSSREGHDQQLASPKLTGDPLLSGIPPSASNLRMDGQLGGYPVRFLYHVVRLNSCLGSKREAIHSLRTLNTQAENMKSYGEFITEEFQRKYASTVLEVYKVNEDLKKQLKEVSEFSTQFGREPGPCLSLPEQIKENCQEESYDMVNRYNSGSAGAGGEQVSVSSPKLLQLITSLSSLMLQVKRVADGERNAAELQALKESVDDIKGSLSGNSVKVFQDCVEVHMQHIQQGLSMMGNLTKFMENQPSPV